ncbi:hypothetical protein KVR01_007649 [Diaporthe batatas]|uniref:uncharacterized protein n=1 Tax=Diaporthe batatas TaxID=748121 RepID=UPI001D058412|nr:uncharacterized protein KVR01_007649 [Diaporthe batatas]KAG8163171.1 hypothetical protein KVR01_007649 [Diaporthe batatas]
MEETHAGSSLEGLLLDILGQAERINRLYTQLTLCFPVGNESPGLRAEVIENLERGLARLCRTFPWLAGKVVQDGGEFKITSTASAPHLVVKELQGHGPVPSWDELNRANFPFRMLDEDAISPCRTMVEPGAERPVLIIQANFVQGGLLLTFNAQHGGMDMTGQGQVIALFAKACRGEDFTEDELEVGNMKRTRWIPISDDDAPDHPEASRPGGEQNVRPLASDSNSRGGFSGPQQPRSGSLVWAYLEFPAASLANLKQLGSETLNTSDATFVSTDDVLTALTWQLMTRARQPGLNSQQSTKTTLTRNVDIRSHFGLPSTYPGLMTTSTIHEHTVDDVEHKPLGAVASSLRAALRPALLRESAKAQASIIARCKESAAQMSVAARSNRRLDVKVSSWAREKLYDLDFGPCLGRPKAVRRPKFGDGAREGLVYFLPRERDGSIVVGVCLREEDMDRLREDEEARRWASWIG